jgi:DNA-binding NarL/FixJ family response regulator
MAKQAEAQRPPVDVRLRVGVIAGDPLRMLGFQSLFADHIVIAIVPVGDADPLESLGRLGIDLVVVAAQNTSQVFEAIRDIRAACPEMRLIVMATHHEREFIDRVLRVGAHGYLTATAARAEIEEAIAQVYDGQNWTPLRAGKPAPPTAVVTQSAVPGPEGYTEREMQVLDLLHTGQSNREIAAALRIEERTVKSHVARLLKKMGVKNRTALIMQAIGQNLVGNTLR